jgi:choice-of-anchor B domain-containing protein
MKRDAILAATAAVLASASIAAACDLGHAPTDEHIAKIAGSVGMSGVSARITPDSLPPSWNVSFLSQVTLAQMGTSEGTNPQGSSMWGWVDPVTRREYAIFGRNYDTQFIDVTNPTNPVVVAKLHRVGSATLWREPKVVGNFAYIGVDGAGVGVQRVDLTKLRDYQGVKLNLLADGIIGYTGSGSSSGLLTKAHTLGINATGGTAATSPDGKQYLYVAASNLDANGIRAFDVTNPSAPTTAGAFVVPTDPTNPARTRYIHEMQVVTYNGPDIAYRGKEIIFAYNVDSLNIVDASNKAAMTQISRTTQGDNPNTPTVERNYGYVHQGWLTADQKYLISNDETDETGGLTGGVTRTHFWDVSDLDAPKYKGFYAHDTASSDHNLYVKDGFVYMSNYRTGLRVFKLGNLESTAASDWMYPVGFFDTFSASDSAGFEGAWNNYPWFPSGNIAVADINGGLIMLKMNLPNLGPNGELPGRDWFLAQYAQAMAAASVPEPASVGVLALGAMGLLRRRSVR